MNRYKLVKVGVDVNQALICLYNDKEFYEEMLDKFRKDTQYSLMLQAFEAGDASLAFQHAHSLKGIAGNLSFVKLYSGLEVLVEELRHGDLNRAGETLPEVRKAYEDIMEALGEGTVTDS